MRRRIFLFAAFLWMAVIFGLSARDADASTMDSFFVGRVAAELLVPGFRDMSDGEQLAVLDDHADVLPERPRVHVGQVVPVVIDRASFRRFKAQQQPYQRRFPARAWEAGTVYAVSDELHQLFVPGRACMPADVMLDSAGVLTGTLFCGAVLVCIFAGNTGRNG